MSKTEGPGGDILVMQDTCNKDPGIEKIDENNHSSNLNESQDFRLVDVDEEMDEGTTINTLENNDLKASQSEVQETLSEKIEFPSESKMSLLPEKSSEPTNQEKEVDNLCTTKNEKDNIEEEDEIIDCTPPQSCSPYKKQVSNVETTSLKRKTSSFDESSTKVLRTLSREDALSFDKKGKEDTERSLKSQDTQQTISENRHENIIIAETQDTQDIETTNLGVNSCHENVKITDQQTYQNKTENSSELCCNVDKNENLNDSVILSESRLIEDIRRKDLKDKKLEQVNDNNTMSTDTKDKQETVGPTSANTCNSRMSIQVVYEKTPIDQQTKTKSAELVEIDEEGEKIILDSSQENASSKVTNKTIFDSTNTDTVYKSCFNSKSSSDFSYKSVGNEKEFLSDSKAESRFANGSTESKKCDTDGTISVESDIFTNVSPRSIDADNIPALGDYITKQATAIVKHNDNVDILSVSDNEPDVCVPDDTKNKSDLENGNSLAKTLQVEKEIGVYVRLKCLLHLDENTKEYVSKELTSIHCEPAVETSTRLKTYDTSASLADISGNDNRDASPGSVNSNPQLFHLNPSRLSLISSISSSSGSSAASLAAKLAGKDNTHFSLPRVPTKHPKKLISDPVTSEKQHIDELYERLTREWKNSRILTTSILNFTNTEINLIDAYNVSNERLDEQLQKIRSSTPEVEGGITQHVTTPKSTRKGRIVKRPRSKNSRSAIQSNGINKSIPSIVDSVPGSNNTPNIKKKGKIEKTETDKVISNSNILQKSLKQDEESNELIGKQVFAKWSDNNYYPGTVTDKVKTKYKVSFYDGKNKLLIEDFIILIPDTLTKGLSIYAITKTSDFRTCGLIVDIEYTDTDVYYSVETDEGETLRVQIKDISLSSDQAQVLREVTNKDSKSLPSTPKHANQVSLDNMVEGKRRSKRNLTPLFPTPKSKVIASHIISKVITGETPSGSGVTLTTNTEGTFLSDNDGKSSDSNTSIQDDTLLSGVQPEIIGTPNEQTIKGPVHRIKGKPRSKKKSDTEETITLLGPIPGANSTIFKGSAFILTCASLESIDRYQTDCKDSNSDTGTENEQEWWVQRPFVRDRLTKQIIAGGGKIYDNFNLLPHEEYKNTKLITNVPNSTAKSLFCLSVGIPAYNHNWIIRCCKEGKTVNPAEDELPTGWSLDKKSYIEIFQRPTGKPLTRVFVIFPTLEFNKQFASFWGQICENAGAVVLLADKPESIEAFDEGAVIISNHKCPAWAVERAKKLQMPLLSTTWIIQSLIEGKTCPYNTQKRYKYDYIQS